MLNMKNMFWWHFLDYFFLFFHTSVILFNTLGWIWNKTRKANFIVLSLTAFSWFGLGLFYGIGFCPLTEWHWQVLEKLGKNDLPYSYVNYLFQRLLGINLGDKVAEIITVIVFSISFFISLYMNFFRKRQSKK